MNRWKGLLAGLILLFSLSACTAAPESVTVPTTAETTAVEETVPETTEETVEETAAPRIFGYNGKYMTCLTEESLLGIDVSSFQKEVDWEKVAADGISFVMIRVGFRGYGESGVLCEDKFAQENYRGAKAAGLKIGGYFFSQATTVEEAIEEANYVMTLTQDWQMDMPFGFDWECHGEEYRTANVDAQTLTECTKAFCRTMNRDVIIYANPAQSPKEMLWQEVSQYGLWLGDYSESPEDPARLTMWQYTNKGSVDGIKGDVDLNLFFP